MRDPSFAPLLYYCRDVYVYGLSRLVYSLILVILETCKAMLFLCRYMQHICTYIYDVTPMQRRCNSDIHKNNTNDKENYRPVSTPSNSQKYTKNLFITKSMKHG